VVNAAQADSQQPLAQDFQPGVRVCKGANMTGQCVLIREDRPRLVHYNWPDSSSMNTSIASLAIVPGSRVTVCDGTGSTGTCRTYSNTPKDGYFNLPLVLSQRIRSVDVQAEASSPAKAHLCRGAGLAPPCIGVADSRLSTTGLEWPDDHSPVTDTVASMAVATHYKARVCSGPRLRGHCVLLQSDTVSAHWNMTGESINMPPNGDGVSSFEVLPSDRAFGPIRVCSGLNLTGTCASFATPVMNLAQHRFGDGTSMANRITSVMAPAGFRARVCASPALGGECAEVDDGAAYRNLSDFQLNNTVESFAISERGGVYGPVYGCRNRDGTGACLAFDAPRMNLSDLHFTVDSPHGFTLGAPPAPIAAEGGIFSVATETNHEATICSLRSLQGNCATHAPQLGEVSPVNVQALSLSIRLPYTSSTGLTSMAGYTAHVCRFAEGTGPCLGLFGSVLNLDGQTWADGTPMNDSISLIVAAPHWSVTACPRAGLVGTADVPCVDTAGTVRSLANTALNNRVSSLEVRPNFNNGERPLVHLCRGEDLRGECLGIYEFEFPILSLRDWSWSNAADLNDTVGSIRVHPDWRVSACESAQLSGPCTSVRDSFNWRDFGGGLSSLDVREELPLWSEIDDDYSYPRDAENTWSEEAQGLAHSGDHWYVSNRSCVSVRRSARQCGFEDG
jgi:hypothetical protein